MTYAVTYIDVEPSAASQAAQLIKGHCESDNEPGGHLWATPLQESCRENRFVIVHGWENESLLHAHHRAERTVQFHAQLHAIRNSPYDQRVHTGFSVGAESRAAPAGALYVVTHVDVPPPRKDETEVLLRNQAEQSRSDEGLVRYDVFQQLAPRTNHFTVFAVWADEKAFISNQSKPHTRQFRDSLGPMLGAPYDERLFRSL